MPRLLVELSSYYDGERKVLTKDVAPVELEGGLAVSFAAQWRRCGKAACSECPHGPYGYAVVGSGSSKRRIYLGAIPIESQLAKGLMLARSKARRRR